MSTFRVIRTFHRYMIQDFLVIFFLTLTVFTFVMCMGGIINAIDFFARGVAGKIIISYFVLNMPYLFAFTIPMSTLTATLLLFGRLSMDGEITALRSSGMSIWQISAPIILLSILLTIICLILNYDVSPRSHYARRTTLAKAGELNPLDLIVEGEHCTDFPGLRIYIGEIDENNIYDVSIDQLKHGLSVKNIRSKKGKVKQNKKEKMLTIELYNAKAEEPDPSYPDDQTKQLHYDIKKWVHPLNLQELLKSDKVRKKRKDLTLPELYDHIKNADKVYSFMDEDHLFKQKNRLIIEANKRMAISLACFSFTLLGIPLGTKSRRKESSVGIFISIGLVLLFYTFIIIAESLTEYPQYYPELLVWIPVFSAQFIALIMLRRIR